MKIEPNITIAKIAKNLGEGKISSVEICNHYLENFTKKNSVFNAILSINKEKILKSAEESDKRRKEGKVLSSYDGIPIAIKDNLCVEDEPCTCASKILEGFISPYDATVIKKIKAAGMIPFGRTNMDEFAMGSSCENSAYVKTRNPWDKDRVPGGSSGGSAASVALSIAPAALGSDTGGSIRQPAAFCGVVGLKPSYGIVSRYGLVAFASSLDQIGPFTNSVLDSAIVLDIIKGKDPMDCTSIDSKIANFAELLSQPYSIDGLRIGIPSECINCEGLDNVIKENFNESINLLKGLGAKIIEISLPHWKYSVSVYYVIATAEASANLARFDGIRYGLRAKTEKLSEIYLESRGLGFGEEVKRRILLGTFVLSSGYYDAYYRSAQKVRTLIRKDYDEAFKICDVILTPVTPTPPFTFNSKSTPLQMYLSDIFTISVNLAGNCAISVPSGITSDNLPLGVQFTAGFMREDILLKTSHIFELHRSIKSFIPPEN
ncbi:MAG TPA: Asp-tRNA(Asn)/Glu-tRNA(Gln) amidotransferase subunit GatA [Victivallales bacterium]|nr:Asp-tRNA(Asn)/Glu-tRNA(Gln) amidotransferase subunit GatA [Victivallales bacterium]HPO91136.1 Asp-tRNA(Asn)/Glu-tRNA(Gln) amidotransferase subunit GatA [Victivallales bacterium]